MLMTIHFLHVGRTGPVSIRTSTSTASQLRTSGRPLLAAVLTAAVLGPFSDTLQGQTPAQPAEVGLGIVYEAEAELSNTAIAEMRSEVASIFKMPGLRLEWRELDPDRPQETFDRLVVVRLRPGNPGGEPLHTNGQAASLGFTHLSEDDVLPFTEVDCGRLRRFIHNRCAREAYPRQELLFGRAIGRVLAHELYHALARTRAHGEGVTQAMFSADDLTRGRLELPAEAHARIRAKLFPRMPVASLAHR